MSCIVVLDGFGQLHAQTMTRGQLALNAAKALVKDLGLDDRPGEWIHYAVVEETDDPGAARIIGRGKTAVGAFQT